MEGECLRAELAGLTCPGCALPLVAPLVHGPCTNMICKSCLAGRITCPHCQGILVPGDLSLWVPRVVNDQLDGLKVHCPTCAAVVRRAALDAHVLACPLPCPRKCGQLVAPAERAAHEHVCGSVEERCAAYGCAAAPMSRHLLPEHRAHCPFAVIEPAFGALLARLESMEAALQEARTELAASRGSTGQVAAEQARRARPRCPLLQGRPTRTTPSA